MKQQVTIEVDVPEGLEITDNIQLTEGRSAEVARAVVVRFNLRKRWEPPAWMPEGAWLYQHVYGWHFTRTQPTQKGTNGFWLISIGVNIDAYSLAAVHGESFTPPPVDKIQIHHRSQA